MAEDRRRHHARSAPPTGRSLIGVQGRHDPIGAGLAIAPVEVPTVQLMKFGGPALLALWTLLLSGAAPASAAAQSSVTNADIQRLQDSIYDVSREVSQSRSRDAS